MLTRTLLPQALLPKMAPVLRLRTNEGSRSGMLKGKMTISVLCSQSGPFAVDMCYRFWDMIIRPLGPPISDPH